MNNNRVEWADYSKGIAIILIVLGHVLDGMNESNAFSHPQFFYFTHHVIYGFHVPIFFFISGLFTERWVTKRNCILVKAKTLLVPYLIVSLIQGSLNVILSDSTNLTMTWKDLLLNILYRPFGQFWFLYVLFLSFLIYFILRKLKINLSVIFLLALALFLIQNAFHFWVTQDLVINFIYFVSGSILFSKFNKILDYILRVPFSVLIVIFTVSNFLYSVYPVPVYLGTVFKLLIASIGICFVINVSRSLSVSKKIDILRFIGSISLVIYLFHIFATSGCRIILLKLFEIDNIVIHIISGFSVGIAFPILIYYLHIWLKHIVPKKSAIYEAELNRICK